MSIASIVHFLSIFLLRSLFPFKTILAVLPALFLESAVLILIVIKVRGDRETTHRDDTMPIHEETRSHPATVGKHHIQGPGKRGGTGGPGGVVGGTGRPVH